ncbi:hypothetical protein GCM10011297_21360 [Bacterioplanes sanyensis]|uniref:flagellar basal body rod C-terminal domain-containing protein n=1 Tax=Bacterioplanes sanyensis TaxID=1249553 RepID=UPI00167A163B|nr:hypothetical protein [Bacterioplanes sanyensis]GGY48171.1 hypothetical protein GCM10011297_21360 [Bacterioplanes sanyensis]
MNIGSTAGSAFTTASTGVAQGIDQVRQAAQQVNDATTTRPVENSPEVSEGLVNLREGERQVEANAKVLEAADQQLGTLIDIQA